MTADETRRELGRTDAPQEDEVAEAFDRIVSEGAQRLHRTWREVLTTGLAGGLDGNGVEDVAGHAARLHRRHSLRCRHVEVPRLVAQFRPARRR